MNLIDTRRGKAKCDGSTRREFLQVGTLALGGLTLRVPKTLGVRVTMNGFLADFDGDGFVKSGKLWTSAGYDRAARHVELTVSSAMGGVKVEWR